MRDDLIENLVAASMNEIAGDLLAEARDNQESMESAFDCYIKANAF